MSSSTSRFDKRALALVLAILTIAPLSLLYTLRGNPEITFWNAALEKKESWAANLHSQGKPLLVFSGGSTTAFAIDSQLLLSEYNIPSVNLGLHAGAGLDGTVAIATSLLKPGDHLILMSEPAMLAEGGGDLTQLGNQLSVSNIITKDAFFQSNLGPDPAVNGLKSCRPGMYHTVTMLLKIATGRPLYRYQVPDIRKDGMLTTPIREDFTGTKSTLATHRLSPKAKTFLTELKAWAEKHKIQLSYSLPVCFVSTDIIAEQRKANREFLTEISTYIPVIPSPYLGALDDPQSFADTGQHLTLQAAKLRTQDLAKNLPKHPF